MSLVLLIVIPAIIPGLIVAILVGRADGDLEESIFAGMMSAMIGGVVWGLVLLGASLLFGERYTVHADLQALSAGTATSGTFFLGSGTVEDSPVFYYYQKHSDNAYTLEYEYAESSTIVESNEAPYLERDCISMLFVDTALDCSGATFVVPPGSVTQSYNLQLPNSK